MGSLLVSKWVTLNDLERRNGHYLALSRVSGHWGPLRQSG